MDGDEIGIGALAERAGISVSAIRYYERRGLLPVPDRVGGRRSFGPEAVRRLEAIGAAKRLGLSLEEIGELLDGVDRGEPPARTLPALATRRLAEVEAEIARAEEVRGRLLAATGCRCRRLEDCALLSAG